MASNCPYWKNEQCAPPGSTARGTCGFFLPDYQDCLVFRLILDERVGGALSTSERILGESKAHTSNEPPARLARQDKRDAKQLRKPPAIDATDRQVALVAFGTSILILFLLAISNVGSHRIPFFATDRITLGDDIMRPDDLQKEIDQHTAENLGITATVVLTPVLTAFYFLFAFVRPPFTHFSWRDIKVASYKRVGYLGAENEHSLAENLFIICIVVAFIGFLSFLVSVILAATLAPRSIEVVCLALGTMLLADVPRLWFTNLQWMQRFYCGYSTYVSVCAIACVGLIELGGRLLFGTGSFTPVLVVVAVLSMFVLGIILARRANVVEQPAPALPDKGTELPKRTGADSEHTVVRCPQCGAQLKAPRRALGRVVQCTKCHSKFQLSKEHAPSISEEVKPTLTTNVETEVSRHNESQTNPSVDSKSDGNKYTWDKLLQGVFLRGGFETVVRLLWEEPVVPKVPDPLSVIIWFLDGRKFTTSAQKANLRENAIEIGGIEFVEFCDEHPGAAMYLLFVPESYPRHEKYLYETGIKYGTVSEKFIRASEKFVQNLGSS